MKKTIFILFTVIYTFSFSQEKNILDSLKQSLSNQNDTAHINTLIKIAEHYTSFQNDSAEKYSEIALSFSKKSGNKLLIAKSFYTLGYIYYFKEDFYIANKTLDSALKIYESIKDTFEIVKTTEKLGMIYFKQSNYPKAHECFTKELKLAEKVDYIEAQATSSNNIAIIYSNEKEYENALEYYNKALQLYKKNENKSGIAIIQNNIGDIYKKQAKYIYAYDYYFKALKLFKEIKYDAGIGYCKSNIGETYFLDNNLTEALKFELQAQEIFIKINDNFGLSEVYNNLGEIFFKFNNYKKSETYFFKSNEHAKKIGSIDHIQDNYLKLSELYSKENKHKNAYQYYKKYSALKDSIYNTENARTINQLKINYESEKKDKEIKLLNSNREIDKIRISRQKTLLYILGIGILVILIFTTIIFFQKHNKNQAYKILVHKNIALMESEQNLIDAKFEHEAIIDNISERQEGIKSGNEESSLLTEEQREEHIEGILRLMDTEKIFLMKDITVNKIADKLNTNKLYISNIINTNFKQNFNTFINTYRIKEARLLLSDSNYDNYSIEGIAYEVGFNTKSSFNAAFKKFTGVTPSFFKKQVSDNKKSTSL